MVRDDGRWESDSSRTLSMVLDVGEKGEMSIEDGTFPFIDGPTAPWRMLTPRYLDEDADGYAEGGVVVVVVGCGLYVERGGEG